jgi:hypothetical protein
MTNETDAEDDHQDNFVEVRDPTEAAMCLILGACYLGLARFCFGPLQAAGNFRLLVNVEGFFVTIALLSLLIGVRPYLSPSNLQLSKRGIKYHGQYWPQRKTVNWDQVFRLYISPELIVVLYHPNPKNKGIWPLIIQSLYLADRESIDKTFIRYSPVPPIMLEGPSWLSRMIIIVSFAVLVIWILEMLLR